MKTLVKVIAGNRGSMRQSNTSRMVFWHASLGFTLIELMVTITILAIIVSIGMPSFTQLIANQRLTSQANDFVGDVLMARSEAAARGRQVTICTSTNGTSCSGLSADWNNGRIIYVDVNANGTLDTGEALLRYTRYTQISGSPTVTPSSFPNTDWIAFGSYGGMVPMGTNGSFKLCVPNSTAGRQISINLMGRPLVTKVACP